MLCPICFQTNFTSIDKLRASLIRAANGPLSCPICQEQFLGLDKLTIHLFSHTTFKESMEEKSVLTNNDEGVCLSTPVANKSNNEQCVMEASQGPLFLHSVATTTADRGCNKKQKKLKSTHVPGSNSERQVGSPKSNVTTPVAPMPACDICELTFHNENLRDMHFRLVHQIGYTDIRESPISASTSATTTAQHLKESYAFKCHLCPKTFKMKGSLRVHLKVVHMMGLAHVKNTMEQSQSAMEPSLRNTNHYRSETDLYNKTVISAPVVAVNSMPNSPNNAHFNSGNEFYDANQDHLSISNLDVNSNQLQPQAMFTLDAYNMPNLSPPTFPTVEGTSGIECGYIDAVGLGASLAAVVGENAKIWECDVCSKSFTTKYFLKKHKRLHTGEMPYTCEICSRTFTFQQSYHKHLLYHSDEKPHVCTTCGRRFKELSTLHNHERIHSGEKPFKCEVCGKCFRQRVSFLVHTRIHTGVMPYKCQICQKSFRYKVSQRTHKCFKSEETGTTPSNQSPSTERPENSTDREPVTDDFIKAFLDTAINGLNSDDSMPQIIIEGANDGKGSDALGCSEQKEQHQLLDISTKPQFFDEAFFSKTIDDIVVESCKKLGIGNDVTPTHLATETSINETNSVNGETTTLYKTNSAPQMLHGLHDGMLDVGELNSFDALPSKDQFFRINYK